MKISTKRGQREEEEVEILVVYIGNERYRISESIDKKLCINKSSDSNSDAIRVYPRFSNEIEVN